MDEKLVKNAIAMCEYANKKMMGVVKTDIVVNTEWSPYHHCDFKFFPKKGACIEFGCHGGTYQRIFADKVTEYGGWCGDENVYTKVEGSIMFVDGKRAKVAPDHLFREDMIRAAMIKWEQVKTAISNAVANEKFIDEFEV